MVKQGVPLTGDEANAEVEKQWRGTVHAPGDAVVFAQEVRHRWAHRVYRPAHP